MFFFFIPSSLHCPERYTLRWKEKGLADRLRFAVRNHLLLLKLKFNP